MSRHNSSGSYDRHCQCLSRVHGEYQLSWVVDRYYESSRLRFPREYHRDTDEKGARRFCKRWNITFPEGQ